MRKLTVIAALILSVLITYNESGNRPEATCSTDTECLIAYGY